MKTLFKHSRSIHKQLFFSIMLPVVIVGTITVLLISTSFSAPIMRYLNQQYNSSLVLASEMGIIICDTYFNQLIDFRLEENVELNEVYKIEALQEIKGIKEKIPSVEIVVVSRNGNIETMSADYTIERFELPEYDLATSSIIRVKIGNSWTRAHIRHFPFWGWYIISYVKESEYLAPIRMSQRLLLFSTITVFASIFVALLFTFRRSVSSPLRTLIEATQSISKGKLKTITNSPNNELGLLIHFFNEMVANLKEKNERIDNLISELMKSLGEKDILLQEIHHRVKNNLQIINSLISLQSHNTKDSSALLSLKDMEDRITSMGIVHEQLYKSDDLSILFLDEYIKKLCDHLFKSFMIDKEKVRLDIQTERVAIDLASSIPCGLILNEIISNAFKYAFPGERKGKLSIEIKKVEQNTCRFVIADDGVGFPEHVDLHKGTRLGLQLIKSLTAQLKGSVELEHNEGTRYVITFPLGDHQ